MSKKRLNHSENSDLDKELQEYLGQIGNVDVSLPTPKVSGEIQRLGSLTHNRILESLRPVKVKSLRPLENSNKERESIMDMTINFQNLYGKEACKLLTSLETLFENDGRIIPEDLALVIEILKEFLDGMDYPDRIKAVKIALAINPVKFSNVLELNGLLNLVKEWMTQTQPNLIGMFIEQEIVEKDFSEEEKKELSEEELEECQMIFSNEIKNLLKAFNEVLRKYGEVVGNSYMRIYFDEGRDRAGKFLKMIR
jgi:hypothetical protein